MPEPFELLLRNCRLPDGRLADLGTRAGIIAEIGALAERPARRTIDGGGRVLTPGLVDSHIHLDKALISDRAPSIEGTVAEAIRVSAAAKRNFTVEDIRARARRVLDAATHAGTTAMRSHVEVDPIVELKGLEALAALKREFDVDVDFHIDFFDEPEHLHVLYVAEQAVRFGWQGRVAVGHASELAALDPDRFDRIAAVLKEAGIGVIILPATDLYLMGRKDVRNPRRGLAPARRLLAAGVTVAAATNNILNAFTPMGTGDLALMGYLVTAAGHMGTERDVADVLAMLTAN